MSRVKRRAFWMVAGFVAAILVGSGCDYSRSGAPGPSQIENEGEQVFITDRSGKKWDVTHARDRYGFEPSQFQFGLGPAAIRPLDKPQMLVEGDEAYPSDKGSFLVLGTGISGDVRAYPIGVMSRHEVANDVFGAAYVTVAY